jgi:type IV secretion system protein VirB9
MRRITPPLTMALLLIAGLVSTPIPALALRLARPTAIDSRIQVMTYNPDDVFQFTGFYGFQSSIELDEEEVVETISMGDTMAWQIVPSGRRIFLKPIEENATTNMTVLTNQRLYHFELHAEHASGIRDPRMVFTMRFLYPDSPHSNSGIQQLSTASAPDLSEPGRYNFRYTISGEDTIAPIKIFDDGEFTYFEFRKKNAEIPAFFKVNNDGTESIVNYRVAGDYIVIERVTSQFTLRSGSDIVCVFNEAMPLRINRKLIANQGKGVGRGKALLNQVRREFTAPTAPAVDSTTQPTQ